jgi:hypothetical protein
LKENTSDCVLRWILPLEENGLTFQNLPGKKKICLDIDSLKIQDNEEESLIILSGSENSSISNIK